MSGFAQPCQDDHVTAHSPPRSARRTQGPQGYALVDGALVAQDGISYFLGLGLPGVPVLPYKRGDFPVAEQLAAQTCANRSTHIDQRCPSGAAAVVQAANVPQ